MIDRQRLREQLSKHEDRRGFVYDDATGKTITEGSFVRGKPTVGVGRNLIDRGLSDDEIDYLLDNDIADHLAEASQLAFFSKLDQVRQNAVVELVFNLGLPKLKKFVKFIDFMQQERWQHAGEELKDSLWYRQVKGRGDTIISMIQKGQWP